MDGSGTVDNPYIVTTAQELYDIRKGGATPATTSTYYRQGNDISIPGLLADIWFLGAGTDKTYQFKDYNGAGFKVMGLTSGAVSVDDMGLFPIVSTSNVIIRNLGVECNLSGADNVGGIVGRTTATASITNCYSAGDISGADNVGGIVGYLLNSETYPTRRKIENCFALNRKIIRKSGFVAESFGRIVGALETDGMTLVNNYALETMLFYPDGDV